MKSPPKQIADDDAHDGVERFIEETRRAPAATPTATSA